jgi:2-oxoacid:acceptor oxidoreductase delta subunit (pyruvate/2-ketoisovalerate family)
MSGKEAAKSIDEFLGWRTKANGLSHDIAKFDEINTFYFPHEKRIVVSRIALDRSKSSFHEVNKTLNEEAALEEAERCFSCGTCMHCDVCLTFCPDIAIHKDEVGEYAIDYEHCKGCGICVKECPHGAMELIPEGSRFAGEEGEKWT